ncbi:MAG: zinc-dependent metalloprotease [Saprospiraceae bacterium]
MKKTLLILFAISALFSINAIAQNGFCGMTVEEQLIIKERMMQNRANAANSVQVRTGVMWVPIQFHILTDNDGGNRVDIMKVLDMLCALNEDYLDQDIQYFMKDGLNFINNSSVNTNPNVGGPNNNPFAQTVMVGAKVLSAINIYIVKDIPSSSPGNTLGFYSPTFDWLVLNRSQVSAVNVETLTHELGHFFTLPHPFLGWDGEYWEEGVHGNPAPINSPGGVKTELMNGNNCTFAGDGFCDTKPNYGLGFGWSGCNYNGNCMDPNGELLATGIQENNYMAYFINCASEFTPEQKAAIAADLNSRTSLHTTIEPDITAFTDSPTQNFPIDGEDTPLFNVVGFDWEPVAGATSYVVEVDRQPNYSFEPSVKFVSGGTYVEFEDIFDADKTYYWRVKAIKEGNVCGEVLSTSFRTGTVTGVREIKEVLNYTISPNPISDEETLNINIETNEAFEAVINLYNLSGQKIKEVNATFAHGTTNHQLSVGDLSEGMYIISIESENGVLTEKVVVTR